MKKIIFLIVICGSMLFSNLTIAQYSIESKALTLSVYGNIGIPSKELKEAVNNSIGGTAVGAGGTLLYNVGGEKKTSPVALGIDFSYLTFGRDKN
jgi:hypothetical protein